MNLCRDCKFFSIFEDVNYGKCSCPKFILGYGYIPKKGMLDNVYVENDEGWGFFVGPEFGCVHFKQAGDEEYEQSSP